jgi:3-oxoacyl-[acyl-carrier protein] reductase
VNAVAPVATELFFKRVVEVQIGQLLKLAPLECLGQAEDIANAVSFLVRPSL